MDTQGITIFEANKILTMNPKQPEATHIAVKEGRILGVGDLDSLSGWGEAKLDTRFKDKVIMPGLVEGHSHLYEGGMWNHVYVGYYDRQAPDGKIWKGIKSFDELVQRLQEYEQTLENPDDPIYAWGFDPIFFGGDRLTKEILDQVSTTRRIIIVHASLHLINVNSAMMEKANVTAETAIEGVVLGADGTPTGELQEFSAMYMVYRIEGNVFYDASKAISALWNLASIANLAGVTTTTDLANGLEEHAIKNLIEATNDERFPIRVVPTYAPSRDPQNGGPEKVKELMEHNSERLHFGNVKLITDGSIQGFTARVRWPYYYNPPKGAEENGIWIIPPYSIHEHIQPYHDAGMVVHIHTNGDEATEATLDAMDIVLEKNPRQDHRHTLQHCQMADRYQFKRMAKLGLCVNLFSNHIYYWGEEHYHYTMGPDRANRMNAASTAQEVGVPFAIHSDAPVTHLSPLFTAWCAVNRLTAKGRVLGESEKISVEDALHAITLGAAYTLKLDDQIGSLEIGKQADFAVLYDNPLEVAPEKLKDVKVWGTVLGGRVFQANTAE